MEKPSAFERFNNVLKLMVDKEASDLHISVGSGFRIRIYPNTDIARTAREEGLISSEHDLLFPKFYVTRDLEDWLFETVEERMKSRPHWIL